MAITVVSPNDVLRNQFRTIPAYMNVAGMEMDIYIKEIEVNQELGMHDSIWINAEFGITDPMQLADKPFQLRYGQGANSNVFYGYFEAILKNQSLHTTIDITAQGLGWTGIMRRGARRILDGTTLTDVVRPLVQPHGFRFKVDEPTFSSYREAQVEESDWSFLVRVAASLNRFVSSVNGTVWVLDPIAELKKGKALFTFDRNGMDPDAVDYLLDYAPNSVSGDMSTYRDTVGYSYLNSAGKVVTRSPKDTEDSTNFYTGYIPNADWARRVSDLVDLTSFHTATARINGNALLAPGLVCAFMTTRPEQRPMDKFDGLWMIQSVQHKIGMNFFQTNLTMIRDEIRLPIVGAPYVWPITTRPGKLVPFIIVNDRWRM